ncbi:hypothetical protein ACQ0QQ_00720 [Lysinibacillus sphaericus]
MNNTTSISLPTTVPATEVTVATSPATTILANQNIKIDYAFALENTGLTASNTYTLEIRLYRDGALLNTRTFNRTLASAGTQRFPLANTYVDTPLTTATVSYTVRILVTASNNISTATANNINLNLIKF